jgi:hypothetical protein
LKQTQVAPVWRFFGHRLQVAFPTADNTADHTGQCVQMPGLTPGHLFGIKLPQSSTYATIDVAIITHGYTPLIYSESGSVPMLFPTTSGASAFGLLAAMPPVWRFVTSIELI